MTNVLGDACQRGISVNLFMSNPALVNQIEWRGSVLVLAAHELGKLT